MPRLKSVRKQYRQKKLKAKSAEKKLVKSMNRFLDKMAKPKDADT